MEHRRAQYLAQMAEGDKRMIQIEHRRIMEKKSKEEWEKRKEEMQIAVRTRMEQLREKAKNRVIRKLERQDAKLARLRRRQVRRLQKMQLARRIRQEQREEEVARIARKQAYEREKLGFRLHQDSQRVRKFLEQREQMRLTTLQLRQSIEVQKERISVKSPGPLPSISAEKFSTRRRKQRSSPRLPQSASAPSDLTQEIENELHREAVRRELLSSIADPEERSRLERHFRREQIEATQRLTQMAERRK
jgi:hypothetical protein